MDIPLSMAWVRTGEAPESRFEALYEKYYGRVLGYVLRRAPETVAGDVVAEVFVVAWRRLDKVPSEPLPWLLGVARKTLANERRGGRRRAALADVLLETKTPSGEGQAAPAIDERAAAVADAVGRLTESDRELVRLIAWDELTTREAAKVLGISHPACRVRLHRLRRRLAHELVHHTGTRATQEPCPVHLGPREET